jgi:ABC-type spermidine/putrescine transport system permease subunit II
MLRILLLSTLAASCVGSFFGSAPLRTSKPQVTMLEHGLASTAGAVAGASVAATLGLVAAVPTELSDQVVIAADTLGVVVFAVAVVQAYLAYSDKNFVEAATDEACLLQDTEPICGALSFDSTEDMMCIETYREGKLQWVCA